MQEKQYLIQANSSPKN